MGLLDRARRYLQSPADRRLADAEKEAWQSAPAPAVAPLRADVVAPTAGNPPIDWSREQPPLPPQRYVSTPGYHDQNYEQHSAPVGFEGFTLERIRNATALHRLGFFYESCALLVAILGWAPVLAALQQAIAPILALPSRVDGGDSGLSKMLAREIEEQLAPRNGLMPSPYLSPRIWGTMAIYLRLLNFCVLQHTDGEPDPETQIRKRYTRIWQPWALQWTRNPQKLIAITDRGPVEVCDDGKFTLVADEEEPYLTSAILALGEETFAGKVSQEARLNFLQFFGEPKLWAQMPEGIPVRGEEGQAFFAAVEEIRGPGGYGVLPHGASLTAVSISGEGSKAFQDALLDHIIHIFMILTGSAGTIGAGSATGAGPYQAAKGGAWNVRHDLIARPTIAMVRGLNMGHARPYLHINHYEAIEEEKRAGTWVEPVLVKPIPEPDREERLTATIARYKSYAEQVKAERDLGARPSQDRANKLAEIFEVVPFVLGPTDPRVGKDHVDAKIVAPDELRAGYGLPALPGGIGSVARLAQERGAGADEPGVLGDLRETEIKESGDGDPDEPTGEPPDTMPA